MEKINKVVDQYTNKSKNDFKFSINMQNVLPFNTRANRVTYATGFNGIIGEIARQVTNYEMVDINLEDRVKLMIEEGTIDVDNENFDELIMMLDEFNPCRANSSHSSYNLFKFYPLSSSKSVLEIDELTPKFKEQNTREKVLANYILNVVLNNDKNLKEVFSDNEDQKDLCTNLFHNIYESDVQIERSKMGFAKYHHFFDEVIAEDLEFIVQHPAFFTNNFDKFVAYYYFVYVIQTIKNIDISEYDTGNQMPIYWMFDSEQASPNRLAIKNGWQQFKKGSGYNSWVNSLVLDIVNSLSVDDKFITFENAFKKNNVQELKLLIEEFRLVGKSSLIEKDFNTSEKGIKALYYLIDEYYTDSTRQGTQSRYFLWLEDMAKKYFLKLRGRYGYTLNLTEDNLVFLTAIIIKEDRIRLKMLFTELEKRGLYLDSKTSKEVVKILDKQGLLEKKSDSGDAQYVRKLLR